MSPIVQELTMNISPSAPVGRLMVGVDHGRRAARIPTVPVCPIAASDLRRDDRSELPLSPLNRRYGHQLREDAAATAEDALGSWARLMMIIDSHPTSGDGFGSGGGQSLETRQSSGGWV